MTETVSKHSDDGAKSRQSARRFLRGRSRYGLVAAIGAVVISLAATARFLDLSAVAGAGDLPPIVLDDYTVTFDEPFDTLSVSAWGPGTRWIAHTPWNGDFGDAGFADPVPGFPFTVADGILRIEARKFPDGYWRSGLLASTDNAGAGFTQMYGYFEMRAKFPPGEGVWPAFWLIANKDPDTSAEIDVVEYYGKFPESYQIATHIWKKTDKGRADQTVFHAPVPKGSLTQDFHTYGVSIEPDRTVFYLDRQPVHALPTPEEHRRPMFMLVNLALGGGWPIDATPNPSVMEVDYVRAYQRKDRK